MVDVELISNGELLVVPIFNNLVVDAEPIVVDTVDVELVSNGELVVVPIATELVVVIDAELVVLESVDVNPILIGELVVDSEIYIICTNQIYIESNQTDNE